jgi:DNA-directed RNA polymerase subunit L
MSKQKKNINIKEVRKIPYNGYSYSQLVLQMDGDDIDNYTVNCLRRIAFNNIPTYALCSQSINIEFNDSIFNNDQMRLRLEQFPIFNVDNDILFLPTKYWKNIDYSDNKREKFPDDDKNIELYLSVHNDTTKNINVMSDDIKYYEDGEQIENKLAKIKPLLLVQLRPNQTFKAHAKAVLGIGERNDIWSSVSNFYFKQLNNHSYELFVESQGQIDEYSVLKKACQIAKKKLADIDQLINEKFKGSNIKKGDMIEITLTDEDHTIGNVINVGLQNHKDILFSGLAKPDLLIKEIKIKIRSNIDPPLKPLFEVIKDKIKVFDNIENIISSLGKKYIN